MLYDKKLSSLKDKIQKEEELRVKEDKKVVKTKTKEKDDKKSKKKRG